MAGLSGSAMPSGLKAEIDPEEELGIGLVSTADRLGERDFIDTVVHMRYFSVLDNHRSAGLGAQERAKLVKLPRVYGFFDWVIHTKQVWPFDKLDIRINDDAQDVLVLPNPEVGTILIPSLFTLEKSFLVDEFLRDFWGYLGYLFIVRGGKQRETPEFDSNSETGVRKQASL